MRRKQPGAPSELEWILRYRARAQAQSVRLTLELATDLRRIGEREQALDLLLQALEQEPLQIEAAQRAMLLLSKLGRAREALSVYEHSRRVYRDAYGSDPNALKPLAADLRAGRILSLPPERSGYSSGTYPRLAHPHRQ